MSLLEMVFNIMVANVMSFGNGSIMLALLQRDFVEQSQALTNEQLLFAYALARVTPGQANLYVSSLGYMMHGFPGAIATQVAIAAPGYLMLVVLRGFRRFRDNQPVQRFVRGLASTSVGIMLAITLKLSLETLVVPFAWVVMGVALALLLFSRLPAVASLLIATLLGIALVLGVPGMG